MAVRGSDDDLVRVSTARAVLARVNLLAESSALAIDIGGNLAKLLYLQPHRANTAAPTLVIDRLRSGVAPSLSVHVPALSGTLHFFAFETRDVEELVAFVRAHWLEPLPSAAAAGGGGGAAHTSIRATGGGAYKYARLFRDAIGVSLARLDEMTCTVAGLNFVLSSVHEEVYSFSPPPPAHPQSQLRPGAPAGGLDSCRTFVPAGANPFPYLLVNIGSGVSIVKVTGHGKFERISGSSLGGGTFWGLARLLLNCSTFDDVIELTNRGDHANVDMLVGDIYGGSYASLNLDAAVIASSFGKVTMSADDRPATSWTEAKKRFLRAIRATFDLWVTFFLALPVIGTVLRMLGIKDPFPSKIANLALSPRFRPQDVAMSLLRMVSYNIGQIAYLNARVHNLERIYFGGNFIRNHPHTIADVAFAVDFWSQGTTKALFLKHDGYLGAIGAFIGGESESPAKHVARRTAEGKSKRRAGRHAAAHNADGSAVSGADDAAHDASVKVMANGAAGAPNGAAKSRARARKSRARGAANGANGAAKMNGVAMSEVVAANGAAAVADGAGAGGEKAEEVMYYDDNSEAYREAVAGEWTTVVARGKRKTGDA